MCTLYITYYKRSKKILPSMCYPPWNLQIFEIASELSPALELVSLKFCNTSDTLPCTRD